MNKFIIYCISVGLFSSITSYSVAQTDNKVRDSIRPTLTQLCEKFKSDKCDGGHKFIEIYEDIFTQYRDLEIRFFEIGILNGASHLMWREFFPNGEIFGIDIKDYSEQSTGTGIQTCVADQSNRADLQRCVGEFGGSFDVILDDGGHAMDHQQVSLAHLFKQLNKGGYYIIEDVHTSLPKYYPESDFKVNENETNTTLLMLEWYMRTGEIKSEYMTEEEIRFLQDNIESVDLKFRNTRHHSMMCVIRKKY